MDWWSRRKIRLKKKKIGFLEEKKSLPTHSTKFARPLSRFEATENTFKNLIDKAVIYQFEKKNATKTSVEMNQASK